MYRHASHLRRGLLATAATLVLATAAPALAAQPLLQAEHQTYDLKAQPLAAALAEVARISGRPIVVSTSLARGKTAPPLKGRFTPDQAYAALLSGSGLKLVTVGNNLVVQPADTGVAAPITGESPAGDAEQVAEVVVTGTRIRGAAPAGAQVITISREDIEASGYATTQQIVQALPQNFGGGANEATTMLSTRSGAGSNTGMGSGVNLRGLGTTSTLVLLNGERPAMGGISGTFADLSLIPASAVQRIEVLPDGASALYGSDAVAGVVNVVFRDRFEGAETRLRYATADGDFDEVQAGQLFGKAWDSGHLILAYEYHAKGRLAAADRDYAREDLRPFGGGDYRANYSTPGTIVAGGRTFAIPAGQNGVGLTPSQLLPDQINRRDARLNTDLLPRQRRQSMFVAAEQALDGKTTLKAQLLAADRRFNSRVMNVSQSAVTVPVANPFYVDPIGTRAPVRVQYDFSQDLGPMALLGHVRAYNGVVGLTRTLGDWSASADVGFGQQREYSRYDNYVNTYRLGLALADTNPATAYNLFGDARSTNPATIESIRGWSANSGLWRVWTSSLRADGPLFDLPAGTVKLAIGGEWRAERFKYGSLTYRTTAAPAPSSSLYPGARKILAAYAEVRVPLVAETMGVTGVRNLAVSLAGRVERYSDFGTTATPKAGLEWSPFQGLSLRGSYGRSFRAPSFADQRIAVGYVLYQPIRLTDPKSPTGATNVVALVGNTADIGPERARTWTVGFDLRPTWAPRARLETTLFKVDYRDRIGSINADLLNVLVNRALYTSLIENSPSAARLSELYASPFFSNPSNIPASAIGAIVDSRNTNLASVVETGLDFDARYAPEMGPYRLELGLSGSYLFNRDQKVTPDAPKTDVVGTVGNPVDLRLRGRAILSRGSWDTAAFVNFYNHYTNQTVAPAKTIKAWTTVDLQLGYRFGASTGPLDGVRLALTASNVFDKDPPFADLRVNISGVGFDSEAASPVGRLIGVQATKSW
ncbi:TonB-dependent receptor [Caulobacter segnis]|uniref:TonB-dependent receptor n=1 Tax=Caulobacter segnis TaxID=88688 RepID=A0A2W5V648_9CAUL|nr:TonB-dependent receptor [Caulobacter segnis]PZR35489.1 MAG: TonB-dependent receptor [Caulobacter segnis]